MAKKEEKIKTGHGIYKLGEKYVCEECDHEVEMHDICPTCKKDLDWEKIEQTFMTFQGR